MNLNNYDIILLDCDGVILNSNKIKTNCFREILSDYNKDEIDYFIKYHQENAGVSRFKKIEYFLSKIIKKKRFKTEYEKYIKQFSILIKNKLLNCKTDPYLIKFLKKYKNKKIFIVSGAYEKELKDIFAKRKLLTFFDNIYGSPTEKNVIIKKIKKKYPNSKIIFIGDSKIDYEVSIKNNIDFIFKYTWTEFRNWKLYFKHINVKLCKYLNI